jgi:zinc protease
VIVGDISAEEVKARLIPKFEKMPAGASTHASFEAVFGKGPETIKINRDITQANIILGHIGVSRENPDFYALTVMNYILGGGGFSSRLMQEIRNKRGLAYSVASFFNPGKYPGSFQIVLQTKNSSAREAIDLSLQQLGRIRKEPVSEKELEGAKKLGIQILMDEWYALPLPRQILWWPKRLEPRQRYLSPTALLLMGF